MLYVSVPGFNMHNSIFVLIYTLGFMLCYVITLSGKVQQRQSSCLMVVYFLACCGKEDHDPRSCVGSTSLAGKLWLL